MIDLPTEEKRTSLVRLWRLRSWRASKAHYAEARRMRAYDSGYTVANVTTAIILVGVSSAYWFVNANIQILSALIGAAAILNVIASMMQYIFDFRSRAAAHKRAGAEFSMMSRKMESMLMLNDVAGDLRELRREIDDLGDISPVVSGSIWESLGDWSERIQKLEAELFPTAANGASK